MQTLIPTINAASVEQEAMAASGKKSADQLTAQEKAAAVLAIVQKDGAAAMGDFARTADGFANSSKTLTAQLEDQKAALGDKLLPVAKTVLDLFSSVGVPVLGAFGDVLGIVGQAVEPVVKLLGGLITGFSNLPAPIQTAIVAFTAVTLLKGPLASLGEGVVGLGGKG